MKKSLITLAILGASVGVANAQSSVTIYGSADISYMKQTGSSHTMSGGAERGSYYNTTASDNTYIGFMGSEDLGGGLKATFQLEKRFNLANGSTTIPGSSPKQAVADFDGASNVGLSGNFGQFRFGRVNELSTETYRRIDPFDQNGVAGALTTAFRGDDGGGRLGYTARYDSPAIKGFNFGASYTVKNGPSPSNNNYYYGADNAGYALSGTYTNGPLYLVANYNKAVNSSDSYNWNIGGAYTIGDLKLSAGYEKTTDKDYPRQIKTWLVGAAYTIGNGVINAAYSSQDEVYSASNYYDNTKLAIGYAHNLSKRTSLYANYARVKEVRYDGSIYEQFNAAEVGITHKF